MARTRDPVQPPVHGRVALRLRDERIDDVHELQIPAPRPTRTVIRRPRATSVRISIATTRVLPYHPDNFMPFLLSHHPEANDESHDPRRRVPVRVDRRGRRR